MGVVSSVSWGSELWVMQRTIWSRCEGAGSHCLSGPFLHLKATLYWVRPFFRGCCTATIMTYNNQPLKCIVFIVVFLSYSPNYLNVLDVSLIKIPDLAH